MLDRLSALPIPVHALISLVLAAGLAGVFEYIDADMVGFAINPIVSSKVERDQLQQKHDQLEVEVRALETFKAQLAQKQRDLANTEAELARTNMQIPTNKNTDNFIRVLERSSANAQVSVRKFTAQPVVYKDFYAEMPFQVELDGPYFNMKDYFDALSRNDRIINVSSMDLKSLDTSKTDFQYVPGTSVAGKCTVTTYYIPSDSELAAAAPPPPGGRPGAPPVRR
jgi:type IV pilus assembly protein PilO